MKYYIVLFFILTVCIVGGCAKTDFTVAPESERSVEIGILLRKQFTKDVCQQRRYRHIQVLLDGDEIMGYNIGVSPTPSFIKYVFVHIPAEVRDYDALAAQRMHYRDAEVAQNAIKDDEDGYKIVTDWVKIQVTPEQAEKLRQVWYQLKVNPPEFRLWGDNCASRLAEMFVAAGILPWGLPGFDTPEAVLKQLKKYYPDLTMETGYFGFDQNRKAFIIPLQETCPGD